MIHLICNRALFLLHQEILADDTKSVEYQWVQSSRSALGTAAKIVVDVARHHMRHITIHDADADVLPLCCSYNIRLAMKHLQNYVNVGDSQMLANDMESLVVLERAFNEKWKPDHNDGNSNLDVRVS
jgi:hypothetical protein